MWWFIFHIIQLTSNFITQPYYKHNILLPKHFHKYLWICQCSFDKLEAGSNHKAVHVGCKCKMQGVKSTYYQISYHQLVWQWYSCIPEIFLDFHRSINSHIEDRMGGLKEITTNRCIITLHPLSLKYLAHLGSPSIWVELFGQCWAMDRPLRP